MQHHRKRLRLQGFDYTSPGAYFVTTCTYRRIPLLSRIEQCSSDIVCRLSEYGHIAEECLTDLQRQFPHAVPDTYIIMPDHVHILILISPTTHRQFSLSQIVGTFKTMSAKRIRLAGADHFRWQRSFYESVIRDNRGLPTVRNYILNNPLQWWRKHHV